MLELYHKEGWTPKDYAFELWCWKRLLRVPWTTRRLSQSILREINPEEDIGQTDAEAPKLWPPHVKSWLSGKDPDNGEDWRHEEKGMAEMVGWYHWLNGHEFQQALEGQKSLTCCSSWGRKEFDTTEWLNKIHTTWLRQASVVEKAETAERQALVYMSSLLFPYWVKLLNNAPTAAAAAKSLQPCPTLCNPIDSSPPGSSVPGILQVRTLEWVAISFSNAWKWKVKVKLLSRVRPLATPWTAAYQPPPPMGFSRQEYWSVVPLPSPNNAPIRSYLWKKERNTHFSGSLCKLNEVTCMKMSSPYEVLLAL